MTESFGARATQLAGFANAILGWNAQSFWTSTPAELAAAISVYAPIVQPETEAVSLSEIAQLMEQFPDE